MKEKQKIHYSVWKRFVDGIYTCKDIEELLADKKTDRSKDFDEASACLWKTGEEESSSSWEEWISNERQALQIISNYEDRRRSQSIYLVKKWGSIAAAVLLCIVLSVVYFANPADHVATSIFPICPVDFSTGFYYEFLKGDLARDNVGRKPEFGKVAPAKMGHTDNTYKCNVDQIIVGVDQIGAVNYQRAGVPASIDPRRNKVRFVSEQQLLHLDILFAQSFFRTGVWDNEFTGISQGTPSGKQFLKFSDANFDPVNFFDARKREIKLAGRRMPNKLSLGYDSFTALKNHPDILERVKYTGSSANPAVVNENVLAQILGFAEVKVLEATYNAAEEGQPDDMQFVCESDGALMTYTTNTPAIDEPSAGYIFTWDMLGNGNWMATDQFEGESGTHSEFIEGLMSTDMKKTSDDLACYMSKCV